jgi:hypothetical protein
MLFSGVLLRNTFPSLIVTIPHEWTSKLWSLALTSVFFLNFQIIARSGLYLDLKIISKNKTATFALGCIPLLTETIWLVLISVYLFEFPISWAFTLAFGTACMSPGVVVPLVLNLLDNGWAKSWIPPICLAGVSVDVLLATVGFGISLSSCFGHFHPENSMHSYWIFRGLEEVFLGVFLGACIGSAGWIFQTRILEKYASGFVFILSTVIMSISKCTGMTGSGFW